MKSMFLFLATLWLFMPVSHAASFDCTKARSPLEKNICSNRALGDADKALVLQGNRI